MQATEILSTKPEPVYVSFSELCPEGDISYGDPDKVFGIDPDDYIVDQRVYTLDEESIVGTVFTFPQGSMELTAQTLRRAVRLSQKREGIHVTQGGKILYLLYKDTPGSLMSWDHVPITTIENTWPQGVELVKGSLESALASPRSRILAVDVAQKWIDQGGDPTHHPQKNLGRIERMNIP